MSLLTPALVLSLAPGVVACSSESGIEGLTAPPAFAVRGAACPPNYELLRVDQVGDSAAGVDANGDGFVCRRVFKSGKVRLTATLVLVMS